MDTSEACKEPLVGIQAISPALPMTRRITAALERVAGASLADIAPLLKGEQAVVFVYFVPGYFLCKAFEIVAKRRETLEVFQLLKKRY